MPKLNWKPLTKKRGSSTQGLPPRQGRSRLGYQYCHPHLWRTRCHPRRYFSVSATFEGTGRLGRQERQKSNNHLRHPCPRRPFLRSEAPAGQVSRRKSVRHRFRCCGHAKPDKPRLCKSFWEPRFPGQVPSQLVLPEILEGETLYLEGQELKVIELGHTDTSHSTASHVPSIGLVISGDAVYNNTHPYLAECDDKARGEWLRALDKIEPCIREPS